MAIKSCPNCDASILVLNRPCWNCGLIFIQGNIVCSECNKPESAHLRNCPPIPRNQRPKRLCPLCGGKMHRHDTVALGKTECLWRQCFGSDKQINVDAGQMLRFQLWLEQHPNLPSGPYAAERILKQQKNKEKAEGSGV